MRLAGIVSLSAHRLTGHYPKNSWQLSITPTASLKAMASPVGNSGRVEKAWGAIAAAYPEYDEIAGFEQQWDCHAAGGALGRAGPTFDLESFRGDDPNWRWRVAALTIDDPGWACRWGE